MTVPAWRNNEDEFWIGLVEDTEGWKWTGRVDDTFDESFWDYSEPTVDEVKCGFAYSGYTGFYGGICSLSYNYICEMTYN